MTTSARSKRGAPDFYFRGGVNWYTDDAFAAVQRPGAYGLYWALTAWSRGKLTDGLIPDHMVALLAGSVKADARRDRDELLRVGLLTPADGGVAIRDYGDWQECRADVDARREKAKGAADARWHATGNASSNAPSIAPSNPPGNAPSNAQGNAETEAETETEITNPSPKGSPLGIEPEAEADIRFLSRTLDRPWSVDSITRGLESVGVEGLLKALADQHFKEHREKCIHATVVDGRVVSKRGGYATNAWTS
jgi:hypothetical protein